MVVHDLTSILNSTKELVCSRTVSYEFEETVPKFGTYLCLIELVDTPIFGRGIGILSSDSVMGPESSFDIDYSKLHCPKKYENRIFVRFVRPEKISKEDTFLMEPIIYNLIQKVIDTEEQFYK